MKKIFIGPHLSIGQGIENVPEVAKSIGATTFALFLGNVKRWESKPISNETAKKFKENCELYGFDMSKIVPHAKYMVNLGNPDNDKIKKSIDAMIDELNRAKQLGLSMVNVHPGSGLGVLKGYDLASRIGDSINSILKETSDTKLVVETTAGQGNDYGRTLEEIASLISYVDDKSRIGVCIDTCHSFAAGYSDFEEMIAIFKREIGVEYLNAVHLNDSKCPSGSRKDRHANLFQGEIDENFFRNIVNHPDFLEIPFILETPDNQLWKSEINWVKNNLNI